MSDPVPLEYMYPPTNVGEAYLVKERDVTRTYKSVWSFWYRHCESTDHWLVDWEGRVREPTSRHDPYWTGDVERRFYAVAADRMPMIIMAARHFRSPEQWYRFAERQALREEKTDGR